MNGFTEIYNSNGIKTARSQLRKGLIAFCAVFSAYVAFCAVFVVLFVKCGLNVCLCFALNFIASVAFAWYAVIYFRCVYYNRRQLLNFYRSFENADLKPARGVFTGIVAESQEQKVAFTKLVFKTFEGEREFLIKSGIKTPFAEGKEYDLLTAGNKIFAYKGAENA